MVRIRGRRGWPGRGAGHRPGQAFHRDERGGTAVTAIVFLPVIILSLGMLIVLWQTMLIRRSLHTGTYLATRYLSLYPLDTTNGSDWGLVAQRFVWAELKNNPFVDASRLNDTMTPVRVDISENQCNSEFTVTAKYQLFTFTSSPGNMVLPGPEWAALEEVRPGKVLCK